MQTRSKGTRTRRHASAKKRESGLPGGGKGRRDIVRGSRVYPMSGPLPRKDAIIRGEAEWGQGERGAAGYEDSGESGLESVFSYRRTRARIPRKAAARQKKTSTRREAYAREAYEIITREIPLRKWIDYFNEFNRRHTGWLAEIEIREGRRGAAIEARRLPFHGITADIKPRAHNTISVILAVQTNLHLTHLIPRSKEVHVMEAPQRQILIIAESGQRTTIRFQEPNRGPRLLTFPRSKRTAAG